MKTCNPVLRVLVAFSAFACMANAADAPTLIFKFTKAHVPGAKITIPATVNNNGVEVGIYEDKEGVYHGYMFNGKSLTKLDDPDGTNTNPQSTPFNSERQVVGYYTDSGGNSVGFRYDAKSKQFEDITGPEGATSSAAEGINDQGWISGYYTDSAGLAHGFLLQGTTYTTLDPPGTMTTYAYGINNQGNVALTWVNSTFAYEGALYDYKSKKYKTIKVPGAGASGSEASYINNEDDITFWWFDSTGRLRGALCTMCDSKNRKYYKFDYPKAIATVANGINDKKTFAGEYLGNGPYLGYTATFQ
jgi:hypothetical protein